MSGPACLRRICLTVTDTNRAERFYREALGLVPASTRPLVMRLGRQEIELVSFEQPGAPYPADTASCDVWFHHFAIVVGDMAAAHARVAGAPGFSPITVGGPQRLPPNTGSVAAFKFRDPDGHPLELLQFAPHAVPMPWRENRGLFQGIDHTAFVVADVERSVAFYSQRLGLRVMGRSLNRGPEQSHLDDLPDPVVEVVALAAAVESKPHVELLGYRAPLGRPIPARAAPRDIAMTRLVFEREGEDEDAPLLRDPDGHLLVVEAAAVSPGDRRDGRPRAGRSP